MFFFLDTNVLFSDPFLTNAFHRKMLSVVKHHDGTLYLSEVVVEETKAKMRQQVEKYSKDFHTSIRQIQKYSNNEDAISGDLKVNADDCVTEFEKFLEELKSQRVLEVLPAPDGLLTQLVMSAIDRKKPFFNTDKQSFRDAIIWSVYAREAEEQEIYRGYLITENTKDFSENKKDLHPALLADTQRLVMYQSAKDMFENENELNELYETAQEYEQEEEFTQFYEKAQTELTPEKVIDLFSSTAFHALSMKVSTYVEELNLADVSDKYFMGAFPYVEAMYVESVEKTDVSTMDFQVLVTGTVQVHIDGTANIYNSFHDSRDDKWSEESFDATVDAEFSFIYAEDNTIKDLELYHISLDIPDDYEYEIEDFD